MRQNSSTLLNRIDAQKSSERELRSLHQHVVRVQELERRRLAQELHDGVGQILSVLKFQLHALPEAIGPLAPKVRKRIVKMTGFLGSAMTEIRRISHNLLPSELADLGLQPALLVLCREFKRRWGVPAALDCVGSLRRVDPERALLIFRIAQEALNNAGKHSQATRVTVSVRRLGRELELSVSDNGKGCLIGRKRRRTKRGMGLNNVRERVESLGGVMAFHSSPWKKTELIVRVPIYKGVNANG